jgi:hypothetical protein
MKNWSNDMKSLTNTNQPTHSMRRQSLITLGIVLLFVTLACSVNMSNSSPSLEQTKAALDLQSTILAQQAGQNQQATSQSFSLTKMAADVQATVMVQQATQLAAQATQLAGQQPIAPAITQAPLPQTIQPGPVVSQAPNMVDVEQQIKKAKILLFEDMAGTGWYELWQDALDMGGYTYKDDGSAQGWFKDDLLGSNDWDLIIAASESRTKIQGEFFVYLLTHINRGAAVIIEHWALDDLSEGKVAPILAKCGVAFQKDWFVPFFDVLNLSVWILKPDSPIFHEPYEGISLRNFNNFWSASEDKGDLLKFVGGDAEMLAGTIATSKMDHATLVSCLGGRMVIQTMSSHEYNRSMITMLMQNAIHYTLKNHFLYLAGQ